MSGTLEASGGLGCVIPESRGLILKSLGFTAVATMSSNGVWSAGKVTRSEQCSSLVGSSCHDGTTLAHAFDIFSS